MRERNGSAIAWGTALCALLAWGPARGQLADVEADYLAGTDALDRGDTAASLASLVKALAAAPPGHPLHVKTLYALGFCGHKHLQSHQDSILLSDAIGWLERFLTAARDNAEYEAVIPKAELMLAELKSRAAPPPAVASAATAAAPSAPAPASSDAPPTESSFPWHWVALGGAVAAGGAGTFFGVRTLSEADAAGRSVDPDVSAAHLDDARSAALWSTVCFGVAGAAAVGAGVLWWLGSDPSVSAAPSVSAEAAGFSFMGRF